MSHTYGLITDEHIVEWDRKLRDGLSIFTTHDKEKGQYVITIVRRIHGVGADLSDPYGLEAYERVDEVLNREAA